MTTPQSDRYDGFLSYSHAADGVLAPQLQSALHAFAKPWYRLRSVRVFRDQSSLSATPELWPSIETALRKSEYLLLMASPDAARSHWVIQELDTFLRLAGSKRVLIVLTDGELVWDERACDFDWSRTNAFPRLGRSVFDAEPLWVDLRNVRSAEHISLRNPDFHDAVARLSAALRAIPADQLIGEDIRQHRKTVRLLWLALAIFASLAAGLAIAGLYSYRKGVAAEMAARRTRAEFMVSTATTLENDDPLTAALILSELDTNYQSDRGLALLRRVANELPVAVLPGTGSKFGSDGSRFLTFPNDGTVLLWSTDSLTKPVVLKGHGATVIDGAIDSRGRRAAIGCDDHSVTVWDVDAQRNVAEIGNYEPRYPPIDRDSIAFSGDGSRVAFLNGRDGVIADAAGDGRRVALSGHGDAILSIAFSSDGRRVVTTSLDRTTRVWDTDGNQMQVFRIDRSHPISAEFSPDGGLVLTHDDIGTIRIWRIGGSGGSVIFNPLDYSPYRVAFHPDGSALIAGTKEGAVLLWRVDAAQRPFVLRGHTGWVRSVAFTPDGAHAVSTSDDGTARLWTLDTDRPIVIKVHHGTVSSVHFDAKHRHLFTSGAGGTTEVWNPDGEEGEARVLKGHRDEIATIDFSPDGERVVTASKDGTARVWSVHHSGNTPVVLRGHTSAVKSASFSPDGTHILTVSGDGTARIWRADGVGDPVVLREDAKAITSAAFSPDGKRVITAAGVAHLWTLDRSSGPVPIGDASRPAEKAFFSPDGKGVLTVSRESAFLWKIDGNHLSAEFRPTGKGRVAEASFSPDGTRVIGYAGNEAIIWHADQSGQPVVLRIRPIIHEARFSPDSKRVLVVGFDAGVSLWRADGQGEPLVLQEPAGGRFWKEVFSADRRRLATSTTLRTVMVWKTDGPSTPLMLAGHSATVDGLAFAPDGRSLATASWDGTARIWSLDWQDLMAYLRTRTTQTQMCLTSEERMQYLGEEAGPAQTRFQSCMSR